MSGSDVNVVLCTRDQNQAQWLEQVLGGLGRVISASENIDELAQLVEVMGASLVFVGLDRIYQSQQCSLIESLLEVRSMVTVVAVGDGHDSELVIAAMRAGAREFITQGTRASEVQALIRRLTKRLPQLPARSSQGRVVLLYGAQPDTDAAFAATHLALKLQADGKKTLLVDLGAPLGESKAVLGIECSFHFDDALRNLRRLDSSVIENAFSVHESGLRVLPLLEEFAYLDGCSSAELFLLFGSLRQNFEQIVVNFCGQPDHEHVRALAGTADRLLWHVDQSVPCGRRNLELLQRWRGTGINLTKAQLVVDRYLSNQAPDADTLAEAYDLPLAAVLPLNADVRLACRNSAKPVIFHAPRDSLSRSLIGLARTTASTKGKVSLWQRIRGIS